MTLVKSGFLFLDATWQFLRQCKDTSEPEEVGKESGGEQTRCEYTLLMQATGLQGRVSEATSTYRVPWSWKEGPLVIHLLGKSLEADKTTGINKVRT